MIFNEASYATAPQVVEAEADTRHQRRFEQFEVLSKGEHIFFQIKEKKQGFENTQGKPKESEKSEQSESLNTTGPK